jgi:hypothetical protein
MESDLHAARVIDLICPLVGPVVGFGKVVVILAALVFVAPLALAEALTISEADCRYLTRHEPSSDVAYQPGVDVHGKAVVPANLGGRVAIDIPDTFTIDIDVFLAERLGIPANQKDYVPEANIAVVTVEGDEVRFNDQPLGNLQQEAIAAACDKKLNEQDKALP